MVLWLEKYSDLKYSHYAVLMRPRAIVVKFRSLSDVKELGSFASDCRINL